jgi:hypothetical protein
LIALAEIITDDSATDRLVGKKIVKNSHLAKSVNIHNINEQDAGTTSFLCSLLSHNSNRIALYGRISQVLDHDD